MDKKQSKFITSDNKKITLTYEEKSEFEYLGKNPYYDVREYITTISWRNSKLKKEMAIITTNVKLLIKDNEKYVPKDVYDNKIPSMMDTIFDKGSEFSVNEIIINLFKIHNYIEYQVNNNFLEFYGIDSKSVVSLHSLTNISKTENYDVTLIHNLKKESY